MLRKLLRPAGIALTVALGAGLCACGGGTATQATGGGPTLTIYEGSAPPTLNPMLQSSNQVPNNLAYDSLLVQTGYSAFTPALAESFQYGQLPGGDPFLVEATEYREIPGQFAIIRGIARKLSHARQKLHERTGGSLPHFLFLHQ